MKGNQMPPERRGRGLALVGYRGTGKTTVGRLLSQAVNRPFVDVDSEIEARSGQSIESIFAEMGEPVFRDWEERTLAEVLLENPTAVVATGGGSVLREQNRRRMRTFGQIIWLKASADEVSRRLVADEKRTRPALSARGVIDEIAYILRERTPIYEGLADLVVETEGRSPEDVALAIIPVVTSWSSA